MRWRCFGFETSQLVLVVLLVALGASPLAASEREGRRRERPGADGLRVELVPVSGAVLRAGERALLHWRFADPDRAPRFEEWEVFLSLDGGGAWPYRLTPHLDSRVRSVEVVLPRVPSEHGRLLLRYGDERDEREVSVPGELVIADAATAEVPGATRVAPRAGESARPWQPGVVSWVEGSRQGLDQVRYESRPSGWCAGRPGSELVPWQLGTPAGEERSRSRFLGARVLVAGNLSPSWPAAGIVRARALRVLGARTFLSLLSRRNE